ncbi:hypothetical protein Tco_0508313 [Tanacetum coccineum]
METYYTPPQYTPHQLLPHSELNRTKLIKHVIEQFNMNQEQFNLNQVKIEELQAEMNHLQEMLCLRNSNHNPLVDLYDLEGSDEGDMVIDSLTKEPFDTFSIGDKEIVLNPLKDIDDLVLIPRVSEKPLDYFDSIFDQFDISII